MLQEAFVAVPTLEPLLNSTELPVEDGIPMETPYHRSQMNLLIDLIDYHWRDRHDYYVGGNMFVYFSETQARNRDYRGPDFFIVKDVDGSKHRDAWIVWQEDGRYPDLIVELLSESTAELDKTVKKRLYERTFRTPEYFCYDLATQELIGWRMGRPGEYEPIEPDEDGRLWSSLLQLGLGTWQGEFQKNTITWLRFFDENGELVPTPTEAEAERAAQEAERAAQEAQRADRAESQIAQLQAEVERLRLELQKKAP
ncbi:MAG: Uma2 family endonuclease [Caldilineaceae bacterium]